MPSLSKPGIVYPIQQTTGVLVQKIELTAYLIHIARLPLGSFRCRAAISCLKQYIQGLQSNADYGNKHLASVLAFERLNFRETYAPDEGGNEVITNSGDHQAAAKPASSIDYRKGNQTQDNILPPLHLAYNSSSVRFCRRDKPKKQSAEKAMPQRMYIQLKNSRLNAYRMGIRVKSTAYGSIVPIASMTAVTRNGLTPHRYAPRKYSVSFSTIAGSRIPSA